ncbi:hypothetical protein ACNQVK_01085 [Mycobacterium sp. 134]|uniref:hypothetical protein n=1 Tax=Mycobacterium sp. 134 TaxID=3400425 RepID=UPI003AAB068D
MDARTQLHESPAAPAAADAALCAAHQSAFQMPPTVPPPYGAGLYYTAQPPKRQRGLIIAVAAAIVVAGSLIAGAILIKGGGQSAPAPVPTIASPGQPGAVTGEPGSTCAAWATAKSDFGAVTRLPAGWDYSTPGIDQTIAARSAQLEKVLGVFESQIQPTPVEVSSAARLFVEKQRAEAVKLTAHTFDAADLSAIEGAEKSLNLACGG